MLLILNNFFLFNTLIHNGACKQQYIGIPKTLYNIEYPSNFEHYTLQLIQTKQHILYSNL